MVKTFLIYKLVDNCIERIFESLDSVFGEVGIPTIDTSDPKLINYWRRLLECDIGGKIPRSFWSICAASFEMQARLNRKNDYTWKKYWEFSQYLLPVQRRCMGDITKYGLVLGTFPPENSEIHTIDFEQFRSLPDDLKAIQIETFVLHVDRLLSVTRVFNGLYFYSHPNGVEIYI